MRRQDGELLGRTRSFGLRVLKLVDQLPKKHSTRVIADQLLRSALSVGANYRAACRGRSPAEFRSKLGIVEEEADESAYWIEMLVDAEMIPRTRVKDLLTEANEITAMVVASIKTSRENSPNKR